jgi:hypothetical protein
MPKKRIMKTPNTVVLAYAQVCGGDECLVIWMVGHPAIP